VWALLLSRLLTKKKALALFIRGVYRDMLKWLFVHCCTNFIRLRGLPFQSPHIKGVNKMTEEKKTKPTKKALMKEIESLHNGRFDLVSLNRTNIANIKAIAEMLKA